MSKVYVKGIYIFSYAPLRSLRACSLGVVLGKSLGKYIYALDIHLGQSVFGTGCCVENVDGCLRLNSMELMYENMCKRQNI